MLAAFENGIASACVESARSHVEYFASKFATSTECDFEVELAKSGIHFHIAAGHSILSVLLAAGLNISYSCEEGVCGSCETRVLSGIPDHRDALLSDAEKASNNTMMICCSGSKSKVLVLDL